MVLSGVIKVQTDFQQVGETQFVFTIPDADDVNHIVVFMTGQTPFPEGLGAAVYFSWPNSDGAGQSWQLLGQIRNDKPSAIFKVAKLKTGGMDTTSVISNIFTSGAAEHHHVNAQIGISVEPLSQLAEQVPQPSANATSTQSMEEFIQKMVQNFVNYASSFCLTQADMTPNPSETYVPLSSLSRWIDNFQRRFQQNPYFWKS